jgi:pimeloyl-ACP methyl ester carboxylesterase
MKQCLVVLVHGWCCDSQFWREQKRLFQETDIAVDMVRLGVLSQSAAHARQTIDTFAETVVSAIEARGGQSVVLIGHSMGGPVSIEAAIRLGARCRLVVGVDTFTDVNFYARRPREEIDRRKADFAADFKGAIGRMVDRIVLRLPEPDLKDWIASRMGSVDVPSELNALDSLLDWDALERWPHLRVPVETINSAELAQPRTTQKLPDLTVTEMAGVGHFPMLEDPEVFNRLLAEILARHGLTL